MSAPPDGLCDRLRAYARYAELVAEELEALSRGDRVRLRTLAEERRRLRAEIEEESGPGDRADRAEADALLEHALRELEIRAGGEAEVRERIARLRDASTRRLRGIPSPPPGRGGYRTAQAASARLDVRR